MELRTRFPESRVAGHYRRTVTGDAAASWTFLTNHSHVLLCIHRDPEVRLRDVADQVGITERAAQKIVGDLVAGGYLEVERVGRRNRYTVNGHLPLRHPLEDDHDVGEILEVFAATRGARRR